MGLFEKKHHHKPNSTKWEYDPKDPALESHISVTQYQNWRIPVKRTQETYSTNAPPIIGPTRVPTAYCIKIIPIHFPRSRIVTISVMTTNIMARMPPDPEPWIERPSNNTVNECAIPLTIVPTVNSNRTRKSNGFLPKTWDNEANVGWKTVAQSRKAVPAQKPSRAEPSSFSVTIYFGVVSQI